MHAAPNELPARRGREGQHRYILVSLSAAVMFWVRPAILATDALPGTGHSDRQISQALRELAFGQMSSRNGFGRPKVLQHPLFHFEIGFHVLVRCGWALTPRLTHTIRESIGTSRWPSPMPTVKVRRSRRLPAANSWRQSSRASLRNTARWRLVTV